MKIDMLRQLFLFIVWSAIIFVAVELEFYGLAASMAYLSISLGLYCIFAALKFGE